MATTPPTRLVSDLDAAITTARFKQSLLSLTHENTAQDQQVRELNRRLSAMADAARARDEELAEAQAQGNAARRETDEAREAALAAAKAHEDERARHTLQVRLGAEKATAATARLQQQAQRLHQLEGALQLRELELARLRIEKDGDAALIETFQTKLGEVATVIKQTGAAEAAARSALAAVRDDQAAARRELQGCREAIDASVPRKELVRQLAAAEAEAAEARVRDGQRARALQCAQLELDAARERAARDESEQTKARERGRAQHAQLLEYEKQRQRSADSLNAALAMSMRLTEVSERGSTSASIPPSRPRL